MGFLSILGRIFLQSYGEIEERLMS